MAVNAIKTDSSTKLERLIQLLPSITSLKINENNITLIMYAAYYDAPKCMNILVNHNVSNDEYCKIAILTPYNILSPRDRGYTPLHIAVLCRNLSVLKILLKNHAPIEQRGFKGNTVLHYLCFDDNSIGYTFNYLPNNKKIQYKKDMDKIAICKELIRSGADINSKNDYGITPIYLAVHAQELKLISYLLKNGANPTIKNNYNGSDAFQIAKKIKSEITRKKILSVLYAAATPV